MLTQLARRAVPLLVVTFVALPVTPSVESSASTKAVAAMPGDVSASYEDAVAAGINRARERHALRRVAPGPCVDGTSERYARQLRRSHRFVHQDLGRLMEECRATYASEVLLHGDVTPRQAVRAWLRSPGHRQAILSPKPRRIGVGAVRTADGAVIVVVNFVR